MTWIGLGGIVILVFAWPHVANGPHQLPLWPVLATALVIAGGTSAPRLGAETLLKLFTLQMAGSLVVFAVPLAQADLPVGGAAHGLPLVVWRDRRCRDRDHRLGCDLFSDRKPRATLQIPIAVWACQCLSGTRTCRIVRDPDVRDQVKLLAILCPQRAVAGLHQARRPLVRDMVTTPVRRLRCEGLGGADHQEGGWCGSRL